VVTLICLIGMRLKFQTNTASGDGVLQIDCCWFPGLSELIHQLADSIAEFLGAPALGGPAKAFIQRPFHFYTRETTTAVAQMMFDLLD
jgi:hypothetical protein